MKVILENVSENRDEWLALKRKTVGSSEIADIVGLGWSTPLQVWMSKTGRLPPKEENDAMELGRVMEPFIGRKFSRDTGLPVVPANCMLAHPVHECFSASPDFWIGVGDPEGILECKNVSYLGKSKWDDGGCPDTAQVQLQWQLAISGLSGGYVAGLVGAHTGSFHKRPFVADPAIAEQLFEAAHSFLRMVQSDTPPVARAGDLSAIQEAMHPVERTVDLSEDTLTALHSYRNFVLRRRVLDEEIRAIKKEEDALKAQLLVALKDSNRGVYSDFEVRVKKYRKESYTVKASEQVSFSMFYNGEKV